MISDALLQLTTNAGQAVTPFATAAVVSENVIDMSLARDWGQGCPLYLCMTSLTDIAAGQVGAATGANVGYRISLHASDTATLNANAQPLSYPILATSGILQSIADTTTSPGTTIGGLFKGTRVYAAINPVAVSNNYAAPGNEVRAIGNAGRLIYRKDAATTASCDSKGLRYVFAVLDYIDVSTMTKNSSTWLGGAFRFDITSNVEDPYEFYATGITRV